MSNNGATSVAVITGALTAPEMLGKIRQAMLQGVDEQRFMRTAITAIENTPTLLDADRASLYTAVLRAAQDGLLPDRREGALVAFTLKDGRKMVQWMPMFYGLRKRLMKCGITLEAHVVYAADEFTVELGDHAHIHHKPASLGSPRGEMIGAYAIARTKHGEVMREIMTRDEIEAVHAQSRAKDSLMWTSFAAEAWRKTVGRRLCKAIPALDDSIDEMLKESDQEFEYESSAPLATPEMPPPKTQAPKQRARSLQRVVEAEKVDRSGDIPQGGPGAPPQDDVPPGDFDDF
jgi:recombination protein RecT